MTWKEFFAGAAKHGLPIAGAIAGTAAGQPLAGYLGGQVASEGLKALINAGAPVLTAAAGGAIGGKAGNALANTIQPGYTGGQRGPNGGPGQPGGFPQTPYIQPGAIGQIPEESFWTGGSPGFGYFPQLEQDQYNASQQLLGRGMQNLQQPFRPPNLDFGPIRESARREFSQDVLPGIAERFRGLRGEATNRGSMPYLQRAGERFASDLAAQEAKYGLERAGLQHGIQQTNQNQAMQMLQAGMHPRLQSVGFPGTQGALQNVAGGFGQAAGYAAPVLAKMAYDKYYTGQKGV